MRKQIIIWSGLLLLIIFVMYKTLFKKEKVQSDQENKSIVISEGGLLLPQKDFVTIKAAEEVSGIVSQICYGGIIHNLGNRTGLMTIVNQTTLIEYTIIFKPSDSSKFNRYHEGDTATICATPYNLKDPLLTDYSMMPCTGSYNSEQILVIGHEGNDCGVKSAN